VTGIAPRTAERRVAGLAAWAVAVVLLTWPLGRHLGTHLPNTAVASGFDSLFVAWALAHESRALVTAPSTLGDGNIYHPTRHALFYGEAGFGALPYFLPPFLVTGNPALALNLVFLSGPVLTAWGLHKLTVRFTASTGAGVIAGLTFLTTAWVVRAWTPAAPNYAVLQYFPFVMLLASRPALAARDALWIALLVAVQGLSSAYVAAALIGPLVILGVARTARPTSRAGGLRLLAAVAVALAVLALVYAGYLQVRADNPLLSQQTVWPLQATSPAPWIGPFGREAPTGVPTFTFVLIALGVATRAARVSRPPLGAAWRVGAFWTLMGFALAMRPHASWRDSLLASPHSLVAALTPVYSIIRIPERLGIGGLMGLSVLAGVAFAECSCALVSSRGRRAWTRGVAGVLLVTAALATWATSSRQPGHWIDLHPRPYPLFMPPRADAPLMDVLRHSTGPMLEVPVGPPWVEAKAVYRSIFHRRPLLNGYSGYWPAGFRARMALAERLPDPAALEELRRATGLRQVLVHAAGCTSERRDAWNDVAAGRAGSAGLTLVAREGSDLLFEAGSDR